MDTRKEISTASTVLSILFTGAFILPILHITPLLDATFSAIMGRAPPEYFSLAIGAIGAYTVMYHLLYTLIILPIDCKTSLNIDNKHSVELKNIKLRDFINLVLIFLVYDYLLVSRGYSAPEPFFVGFMIIVTGIVFDILPRMIGRNVKRDCMWTLRIVIFSIPIMLAVWLPAIFLTAYI